MNLIQGLITAMGFSVLFICLFVCLFVCLFAGWLVGFVRFVLFFLLISGSPHCYSPCWVVHACMYVSYTSAILRSRNKEGVIWIEGGGKYGTTMSSQQSYFIAGATHIHRGEGGGGGDEEGGEGEEGEGEREKRERGRSW